MGIPKKVYDYFSSGRRKIQSFLTNDDYSITITFDNNEIRIYEMKDSLFGVFSVLNDRSKFAEAFIDDIGNIAWDIDNNIDSNVVWNNRIDLCADSVYMDSKPVE